VLNIFGLFARRAMRCVVVFMQCCLLQCVAVCCSVLQRVAVCCSVSQCVAVCCSGGWMWVCERARVLARLYLRVLQCVTACCSVSQCVAM